MDEPESFGAWVSRRRRVLHLTQEMLADRLLCALGTLRKIETDERRPSVDLATRLAQELGVPEPWHETFVRVARGELALDHLGLPPELTASFLLPRPVAAAAPVPPSNLVVQRTRLIGREEDLTRLETLVRREDVGLVTLTGPGGTGKTRLAQELGRRLLETRTAHGDPLYPDGVWFVDLAPLTDPDLVLPTIASTLSMKEMGGAPLQAAVSTFLREKRLLLLLDNFEQLGVAAPLLAALLHSAAQMKVLVTSRVLLHISHEHEYPVLPLALPKPVAPGRTFPPAERLMQFAAVELFVQRAQRTKPDFHITSQTAPAMAEICVRLDGLPLALELAAARINVLPPRALLKQLENRLDLLTGGSRDVPARHQTLANLLDWSFKLLSPSEQRLFSWLGVFVGGWTLEAAEAVYVPAETMDRALVDALQSLNDNSLIRQVEELDDEPRFTMLETIREYASHQLAAGGQVDVARSLHAAYYLKLAERAEGELNGSEAAVWVRRLEMDHGNLFAALGWALERHDGTFGLRLAGALGHFWRLRGYWSEGRHWLEQLLDCYPQAESERANALLWLGTYAYDCGDLEHAAQLLDESYQLFKHQGGRSGMARVLEMQAKVAQQPGTLVLAQRLYCESLEIHRELGDKVAVASVLTNLGWVALERGQFGEAQQVFAESLERARAHSNLPAIAKTLNALGLVAASQGDYAEAKHLFDESLSLTRALGHTIGIAGTLNNLAYYATLFGNAAEGQRLSEEAIAVEREISKEGVTSVYHTLALAVLDRGDIARARSLLTECLVVDMKVGNTMHLIHCLEGLAAALAAGGQVSEDAWRSARLWGAANVMRDRFGTPLTPVEQAFYERYLSGARTQLAAAGFAAAWAEGQAMTLEQAVAYALDETNPE